MLWVPSYQVLTSLHVFPLSNDTAFHCIKSLMEAVHTSVRPVCTVCVLTYWYMSAQLDTKMATAMKYVIIMTSVQSLYISIRGIILGWGKVSTESRDTCAKGGTVPSKIILGGGDVNTISWDTMGGGGGRRHSHPRVLLRSGK